MNRTSAPCRRAELDEVHQLVVVDAADDDGVELQARKERGRGGDAVEHAIELVEPGQLRKRSGRSVSRLTVSRCRPGVAQRRGLRREQHAVGRHGQVADRRPGREPVDELRQVAAQQRLATGQPDLVHAEGREDVDERLDLLEVQDVLARQPHVVRLRHAVAAAQVAPVGDREPEVPQRSLVPVEDHSGSL